MRQRNNICQEKVVEQTFVVDSSRLLSFAVGYIIVNKELKRLLHREITLILKQNKLVCMHVVVDGVDAEAAVFVGTVV